MKSDAPVTAERIERALDGLAGIIVARGAGGEVFLPIYRRLEDELARCRETDNLMRAVRDRAARSPRTIRPAMRSARGRA